MQKKKQKRYTGRKNSIRKTIAAILVIAGLALIFGGAGGLEHDYITLKNGIITMFSGCASLLIGLSLGRLI